MAGVGGLEPSTLGLEIRCSIQLSYTPPLKLKELAIALSTFVRICTKLAPKFLRLLSVSRTKLSRFFITRVLIGIK